MNTMQYQKSSRKLEVILPGDFNLNAVRMISELLDDRTELSVDLVHSRFVNSKAIIFLHKLMKATPPVKVNLKNPPRIFFELLKTLGLHDLWNLDEIIEP
jgi:hypothetical protein